MLQRILIKDYALIEALEIELDEGLNVITGETGAGKSIIIDAITLLLGQRGNKENIRRGAPRMVVQGVFDIDEYSPERQRLTDLGVELEDGMLILMRSIDTRGKNLCRANGNLITVGQLKSIGENLVDIHSQHEHNSLFRQESHRNLLDAYGGKSVEGVLKETAQRAAALKELSVVLKETERDSRETERQKENLQFELDEIQKAKLVPGEDEALEKEKNILENREKLFADANEAYQLLNGGEDPEVHTILMGLSEVERHVANLARIDGDFKPFESIIISAYNELESMASDINAYIDRMDFDMASLDQVEKRLSLLASLKRKYGATVDDIIAYGEGIDTRLSGLLNLDDRKEALKKEYLEVRQEYKAVSAELDTLRRKAAVKLKTVMEGELHDLAMEKAVIEIAIDFDEKRISPMGQNHVEFLISVNPGIPPRPIRKIASGGEISRIMLALKCIFGGMDIIETMIFDEIDTGISGRTAQSVAEKILELSRKRQLICITHLPQIAAMADKHFMVEKDTNTEAVEVHFVDLSPEERTKELARMLSGAEITRKTYDHAQEMLDMSKKLKKKNEA